MPERTWRSATPGGPPARRSSRRIQSARLVGLLAVGAVIVLLATSAVTETGKKGAAYRRMADRTYASLASGIAQISNSNGLALDAFLSGAAGLGREAYLADISELEASAEGSERQMGLIGTAGAQADVSGCAEAIGERAAALVDIRSSLYSLVGGKDGSHPLGASAAAQGLSRAREMLSVANGDWRRCAASLRRSPGSPILARSKWTLPSDVWSTGSLDALTGAIASSSSLAPQSGLAIEAVSLSPQAVSVSSTSALLPPTTSVSVSLVVADTGNVTDPSVRLHVSLSPSNAGGTGGSSPQGGSQSRVVGPGGALGGGASQAVVLDPFAVSPGASYVLSISASSQGGSPGASDQVSFSIANAAPPEVTTPVPAKPAKGVASSSPGQRSRGRTAG